MTLLMKSAPVVESYIEEFKQRCEALTQKGVHPHLKVILVGEHPASVIYTRNKKKFCESVGAKCEIIKLDSSISESDFLAQVKAIADDPKVHGSFIQLPLPSQLKHIDVGQLIPAHKDVDGFSGENIYKLYRGDTGVTNLIPCTPKGIITLCDHYKVSLEKKNIVVIGRSLIVGKPMSMLLTNHNATVTLCHSRTQNLQEHTRNADIIISAVGRAKFLDKSYLSSSSNQVVIDVGMNRDENSKTCGDVDFDVVKDHVQAITPVPGGVGPMTILSLIQNLLQAAENSLI